LTTARNFPLLKILQTVLALALVASLFFAGWRIYNRLPADNSMVQLTNSAAKYELNIVLRDVSSGDARVELYPIEYAAIQRDFRLNGRPGKTLEDYLALQLKDLPAVRVQIDQRGRAVARLSAGHWWMRATSALPNGELMEWRMPLTISQPIHTVELSGDNAYERTKKF
jgi:hypothetical protein